MNTRPFGRCARAAFTLMELLTVIIIIAILVGLLIPATMIAKQMIYKAQARTACTEVVGAIANYHTEYGKYPLGARTPDPSAPADIFFGHSNLSNRELFDILRNVGPDFDTPNQYNPKGISYLTSRIASDPNSPKSGFAPQDAGVVKKNSYVDPWGNEYRIAIDADENNAVTNLPYSDFQGASSPRVGAAVFSIGKDAALGHKGNGAYRTGGSASDDILSWQ